MVKINKKILRFKSKPVTPVIDQTGIFSSYMEKSIADYIEGVDAGITHLRDSVEYTQIAVMGKRKVLVESVPLSRDSIFEDFFKSMDDQVGKGFMVHDKIDFTGNSRCINTPMTNKHDIVKNKADNAKKTSIK